MRLFTWYTIHFSETGTKTGTMPANIMPLLPFVYFSVS